MVLSILIDSVRFLSPRGRGERDGADGVIGRFQDSSSDGAGELLWGRTWALAGMRRGEDLSSRRFQPAESTSQCQRRRKERTWMRYCLLVAAAAA